MNPSVCEDEKPSNAPDTSSRKGRISILPTVKDIITILEENTENLEAATVALSRYADGLNTRVAGGVFARLTEPSLAMTFFDWAETSSSYRHSTYTCNGMLGILVRAEKYRDAYAFYKNRLLGKYRVNQVSYGILIDGLCKAGEFQRGLELVQEMKANGVEPNVVIHTTIVRGLCSSGRVTQALIYFRGSNHGCAPNAFTYGTLMDALCKSGQPDEAYELVQEMASKGCKPTVVTYNVLIDGFRKLGKLDEVLSILNEMSKRSCSPDVVTYTMVLDIFCNLEAEDDAFRLLDVMSRSGAGKFPNNVSYNTVFAKSSGEKARQALELIDRMITAGPIPNENNYRTLLFSLCRNNRLDEAYQLIVSMLSRGCTPNPLSYKVLTIAFANAGRTYKSIELLTRMLEHGYILDTKTMNVMLHKFCKAGDFDEALQLFKSMTLRGTSPCEVTYNTLIFANAKHGRCDTALEVWNLMIEVGFSPSVFVHNSVIGSLVRNQKTQEAFKVFHTMISKGCLPSDITYITLRISKLQAARFNEEVRAIRRKMVRLGANHGETPNTDTEKFHQKKSSSGDSRVDQVRRIRPRPFVPPFNSMSC